MKTKVQSPDKYAVREILQSYLNDISRIPLLAREQEKELGYRARNGDEQAIQTLVESNLRFVVKIAKKYRRYGVAFLDLINEGNLGMIEAAKRFDPDRDVRFISYAVWWIRQSMLTLLSNMRHPIRLPVKVNNMIFKVGMASLSLKRQSNEEVRPEDIASAVGLTVKDMTALLRFGDSGLSLDHPFEDTERTLKNVLPETSVSAVDGEFMRDEFNLGIRDSMKNLSKKEYDVLSLRFGLDHEECHTFKQIGAKMGISRERARQIQEKALSKLRLNPKTRSLYSSCLAGAA